MKLKAFGNRLGWSFDYFEFNLKDAIVRQTNAAGAEYFINAGSTNQRGVESELNWVVLNSNSNKIFQKLVISQATTFNDFTFNQYQIGSNNYSGKKLTGVPKEVFVFSVDATFAKNFLLSNGLCIAITTVSASNAGRCFSSKGPTFKKHSQSLDENLKPPHDRRA